MVTILMMSPKMAIPRLLKKKDFLKKGYDVITFVHDFPNNILSHYSNRNIDFIIYPKFGNSGISLREVIITSIL